MVEDEVSNHVVLILLTIMFAVTAYGMVWLVKLVFGYWAGLAVVGTFVLAGIHVVLIIFSPADDTDH